MKRSSVLDSCLILLTPIHSLQHAWPKPPVLFRQVLPLRTMRKHHLHRPSTQAFLCQPPNSRNCLLRLSPVNMNTARFPRVVLPRRNLVCAVEEAHVVTRVTS